MLSPKSIESALRALASVASILTRIGDGTEIFDALIQLYPRYAEGAEAAISKGALLAALTPAAICVFGSDAVEVTFDAPDEFFCGYGALVSLNTDLTVEGVGLD